jgi:citrate lyase gamma subunit
MSQLEQQINIVANLESHYRDHQLLPTYQSQLTSRIQLNSKSLQEFAAAIKQLALQTLVRLPVDFIE